MIHKLLSGKKIVLASASPRRNDLLKLIGLNFIQVPANIDEAINESDHNNPKKYVKRIAYDKCDCVRKQIDDDCVVIAADTIVYFDKKIYGKPDSNTEAIEFLKALSNQTHIVYSCVAVSYTRRFVSEIAKTKVKFMELSDAMINDYILTNEPFDKAGAYGIQGFGSQFIEKVEGCYFNVMGFPVNLFYGLITRF